MPNKTSGKQSNHQNISSNERLSGPERQLRQQAEARLFEWEKLLPEPLDLENSRRLLRELRVHQIELEIQNEELRRSQEELEASRSRYKDLYNFAPVGYLTINEAGLIVKANLTAAALLQEDDGTLLGRPISRFILPEDQDVYYHHRAAIFETQERQSCKLRMLRKDHSPFWARLETVPTGEGGSERPTCWIMLSDISRGMRSAEEKKLLEDQYRQRLKTKSLERMAGAIAHHFNNQLGVVMGNLELATDGFPQDMNISEDIRDYLMSAMEGAKKAAEMSGFMLTYLGRASVGHEPVDLVAICRNALQTLRPSIPKNISLTFSLPTDDIIINANAEQVRQIINNLVTNAWESHGGGEGTVEVRIQTAKSVDIPETHRFPVDWQAHEDVYACLEITDTGCGVDTAEIDRIFDPFYTTNFIGRGLGLPVVMGIVRAHKGLITVVGRKDKGSVFSVFIPVYTGACAEDVCTLSKQDNSRVEARTRGTTILVVDDEPTIRLIAQAVLHRIGFKVLIATSGDEAVALFRQHRETIGCVLCDLVMPGMDGWQTLTALRRLDPEIVFILSSGYGQARAMAGDHVELPQSFLGKPYGFAELQQKIGEAISNGQRSGEPEGRTREHSNNTLEQ